MPFELWTRVARPFPRGEGVIFGGGGISPFIAKYRGISGVCQSYSLDGGSDAAVGCRYRGSLLLLLLLQVSCTAWCCVVGPP